MPALTSLKRLSKMDLSRMSRQRIENLFVNHVKLANDALAARAREVVAEVAADASLGVALCDGNQYRDQLISRFEARGVA